MRLEPNGTSHLMYEARSFTAEDAAAVATWRYPPPYNFYDVSGDLEGIVAQMTDGTHLAVMDPAGDFIGFYVYGPSAQVPGGVKAGAYLDEAVDIGLGMCPDLTGQGQGLAFVEFGLACGRERYQPPRFRLSVATFNERATRVYRRAGFRDFGVVPSELSTGMVDFLVMVREEE